eukprot:maker-scaffold_13-snap-gene-5.6-mRNA-1 protein AED:0.00 eAED:0.00 QI:200/1/1/1/0/0/2/901/280
MEDFENNSIYAEPDEDAPKPTESFIGRVFHLVNVVRTDPGRIVPFLEERMNKFINEDTYKIEEYMQIRTKEGKDAVSEAIDFLEIRDEENLGVEPMDWNTTASNLALAHIKANRSKEETANISSELFTQFQEDFPKEFSEPEKVGSFAECHQYGMTKAIDVVLDLLIDDGNPDRTNRLSLFGKWDYFGCGHDMHDKFGAMTSLVFVISEHSINEAMGKSKQMAERQFEKEQKNEKKRIEWIKKKTQVSVDETGRIMVTFTFTLGDGTTTTKEYSSMDFLV